jgi:hypothetical protein
VTDEPLKLIQRYRHSGVLVDTNLLLLYFVGTFRRDLISQFKRTEMFTADDFDLLDRLIGQFTKVVTVPNILTETSNLAGQIRGDLKNGLFTVFAAGVSRLEENYVASVRASESGEFVKFGLTDAVITSLAQDKYLVLTAEWPLYGYLQKLGIDAINFHHLRGLL